MLVYSIFCFLLAGIIDGGCGSGKGRDGDGVVEKENHVKLHLIENEQYKECFVFHEQYNMFWPVRGVKIEMNHALRIEWSNIERYREFFENHSNTLMITFVVEKREVYKIAAQNRWNTIVHCKILAIETE